MSELEGHFAVGQLVVDLGDQVQLAVQEALGLFVQEDLDVLGAVQVVPEALANDDARGDQVFEDRFVDGGQGAVAGDLCL